MGDSGQTWLKTMRDMTGKGSVKPLYARLTDLGYDVYLANNSGVEYSQTHDGCKLEDDHKNDECFWSFDYDKLA